MNAAFLEGAIGVYQDIIQVGRYKVVQKLA
jgi:hypothetical protein